MAAANVNDSFLAQFKPLSSFEEQETDWLIDGWIPRGQITTLASDGGVGKTTLWVSILSAISSGKNCILDKNGAEREPQLCAFLTSEDSVRKKLRRKLREAGANADNIITPDFSGDAEGKLRKLKFGNAEMAEFIRYYRPSFCVFDPLQGFVPPEVNMGSRNAMRDCLAPLIALGEEVGTSFLIIAHTNKRKSAFGRDRVADSADLWDISRSVLMCGYTEKQGIRYLSNEKNNYTELQETQLFSIDSTGRIHSEGTSWKRDREYQGEGMSMSPSVKMDCKQWIIRKLEDAGGTMQTKTLEDAASNEGYSFRTLRRAKDELKQEREIRYFQTGSAKEKTWYIERQSLPMQL